VAQDCAAQPERILGIVHSVCGIASLLCLSCHFMLPCNLHLAMCDVAPGHAGPSRRPALWKIGCQSSRYIHKPANRKEH
jgi:hypothetical protein